MHTREEENKTLKAKEHRLEVCTVYYLMLMKVPEVLRGLAVNTTNRQSPERPSPPSSSSSSSSSTFLSLRKCYLRENTIKTTLRVKTQHFLKSLTRCQ